MCASFQTKLQKAIKDNSPICLGVDPHPDRVPTFLKKEWVALGSRQFLEEYCSSLVKASKGACALKFQSAYFEAYGEEGFAALRSGISLANNNNLLTILDAKRGDISTTMAAYGQSAFEVFKADALTITPYMGYDVVKPLAKWLKQDKGVFLVWITSNPEGRFLQDLSVKTAEGSEKSVANSLLDYFLDQSDRDGYRDALGFVLGATKLGGLSDELYSKIENLPLLIPGIGPQGGKVTDRLRGLISNNSMCILPMSRALTSASEEEDKGIASWQDYVELVSNKLNAAIGSLTI